MSNAVTRPMHTSDVSTLDSNANRTPPQSAILSHSGAPSSNEKPPPFLHMRDVFSFPAVSQSYPLRSGIRMNCTPPTQANNAASSMPALLHRNTPLLANRVDTSFATPYQPKSSSVLPPASAGWMAIQNNEPRNSSIMQTTSSGMVSRCASVDKCKEALQQVHAPNSLQSVPTDQPSGYCQSQNLPGLAQGSSQQQALQMSPLASGLKLDQDHGAAVSSLTSHDMNQVPATVNNPTFRDHHPHFTQQSPHQIIRQPPLPHQSSEIYSHTVRAGLSHEQPQGSAQLNHSSYASRTPGKSCSPAASNSMVRGAPHSLQHIVAQSQLNGPRVVKRSYSSLVQGQCFSSTNRTASGRLNADSANRDKLGESPKKKCLLSSGQNKGCLPYASVVMGEEDLALQNANSSHHKYVAQIGCQGEALKQLSQNVTDSDPNCTDRENQSSENSDDQFNEAPNMSPVSTQADEKSLETRSTPYTCAQCAERFETADERKVHIRNAHGKRFPCNVCKSRFTRRYDLNKHQQIVHMKVRPFVCDVCHSCFGQKHHLIRHKRALHMKAKDFACRMCPSRFSRDEHLHNHTRSIHGMWRPFLCSMCDVQCTDKRELKSHLESTHQVKSTRAGMFAGWQPDSRAPPPKIREILQM